MHDRKHLCHFGKARGRIKLSMIVTYFQYLTFRVRSGHLSNALTLYHPPSQKSTVYGRWKKTSLTAKLLGRATLILRYYVIRVLRNAVAASNHRWY